MIAVIKVCRRSPVTALGEGAGLVSVFSLLSRRHLFRKSWQSEHFETNLSKLHVHQEKKTSPTSDSAGASASLSQGSKAADLQTSEDLITTEQ